MPLVTSGLYKVTLTLRRAEQALRNVFYYAESGGMDNEESVLADEFETQVLPSILQLLVNAVTGDTIEVESVFGIDAPVVRDISDETGALVGASASTFVAAPFTYFRTTRETRNGHKRFGPMRDEDLSGDFFDSAYLTQMQASAGALEQFLTGPGVTFSPVIARRPAVMPATEWLINDVQLVQAEDRVTTQNTRKRGRGE